MSGEILPHKFVTMSPEDLKSEERKKEDEKIALENMKKAQVPMAEKSISDALRCGRCQQKKVSYSQAQTRSADEPMTTFCECTVCGNRWKVRSQSIENILQTFLTTTVLLIYNRDNLAIAFFTSTRCLWMVLGFGVYFSDCVAFCYDGNDAFHFSSARSIIYLSGLAPLQRFSSWRLRLLPSPRGLTFLFSSLEEGYLSAQLHL